MGTKVLFANTFSRIIMSEVTVILSPKPSMKEVGRVLVKVGQEVRPGEKPIVILSGGSFPDWAKDVVTEMGGKVISVALPQCDKYGNWSVPDEFKGRCETWPGRPIPNLPCQQILLISPDSPETPWEIERENHWMMDHRRRSIIDPCCEVIRARLEGAARRYLGDTDRSDQNSLSECAGTLRNVWVVWRRPIPKDSDPNLDLKCSVSDVWERFGLLLERAKARGVNVVVELPRGSR